MGNLPTSFTENTPGAFPLYARYSRIGNTLNSVRDRGAVAGANSSTAIQNAVNDLPAGGTLLIDEVATPFLVNAQITINKPITIVQFGGEGLKASGGTHPMFYVENTSRVRFIGVKLDGDYPTRTQGDGIGFADCTQVRVEDCELINIPWTGVYHVRVDGGWVVNNRMFNIGNSGYRAHDPAPGVNRNVWVCNNKIRNAQMSGSVGNGGIQTHGSLTSAGLNERFHIVGNDIEMTDPGDVPIGADYIAESEIAGNWCKGGGTAGEGIAFAGYRNQVYGNRCWNGGSAGILQWAVAWMSNRDNSIFGNICWDNVGPGIACAWGNNTTDIQGLQVFGNRCFDAGRGTQDVGFRAYIEPGVTGHTWSKCQIYGNNFRGNTNSAGIGLALGGAAVYNNQLDVSGVNVGYGKDWNDSHLLLGAYHLWVDTTGDLRIKSTAPTSDLDGTVVGSQS